MEMEMEMEMEMDEEGEEGRLDPTQLINLAQTHLRLRNLSLSRQYSLELLSSSSSSSAHLTLATQTLTISDILSAAESDNKNQYAVLQLDSLCDDHSLIRAHFNNIIALLDPIKHSSPLAQHALHLAHAAFACLSDPLQKLAFDTHLTSTNAANANANANAVNANAVNASPNSNGVFWTFCPYCYYVYQYYTRFQGCCLRCHNSICRRVFHAFPLSKPPSFASFAFFPLAFDQQHLPTFDSWSPFVSMSNANHHPDDTDGGNVPSGTPTPTPTPTANVNALGLQPDLNQRDISFFQEGAEIFVHLGPHH